MNIGGTATYSTLMTGGTTAFSATNIRSATVNGTNLYAAGGNSGTLMFDVSNPSSTPSPQTAIQTTVLNTRVVNIANNTLFFSTGSGTTRGLYQVGSYGTIPTTDVSGSTTSIASLGNAASPYGWALSADGLTLYMADDRTNGLGGVYKFSRADTGSSFGAAIRQYTLGLNTGGSGLAVDFGGGTDGVDRLFVANATTATNNPNNSLLRFDDTGSGATVDATTLGSYEILATAGSNAAFRGIVFSPVPEPTTILAVAAAGLGLASVARRLRRRAV